MLWLLSGPTLVKIGLLLILASGHTERDQQQLTYLLLTYLLGLLGRWPRTIRVFYSTDLVSLVPDDLGLWLADDQARQFDNDTTSTSND